MERITTQDFHGLIRAQIEDPPIGECALHVFLRLFWDLVEPRRFIDNWHLHAKCEVLMAVQRGEIRNLIINEPPGSCKSLLCSVFWPAFIWLTSDPAHTMAFASYDQSLVNRDAERFIDLLSHPRVKGVFPEFSLGGDLEKKAVQNFTNSHKGRRFSTTPGSKFIGWHFDGHVYDDLVKPTEIVPGAPYSQQKALEKAFRWINETASSRAHDAGKLWRVVVAQRLHKMDPSGQLLSTGDWEHLCFPERFVPRASFIVGDLTRRYDMRRKAGELLWPSRRPEEVVQINEKNMRSAETISAQNQQNPSSNATGILPRRVLHFYQTAPNLGDCRIAVSMDASFKGIEAESSRCAAHVWAHHIPSSQTYLLAAFADWLGYAELKSWIYEHQTIEPYCRALDWVIEDKANGPALVSDMAAPPPGSKLPPVKLTPFSPGTGDKAQRMLPHILPIKAGEILWPDPDVFPWAKDVIDEITTFPRGEHNDHWDAASQGLSFVRLEATSYKQALEGWRSIL